MDKVIVNIIHRPEMVPEYSATVTGQGKEEDIGDKKLITEQRVICNRQSVHNEAVTINCEIIANHLAYTFV